MQVAPMMGKGASLDSELAQIFCKGQGVAGIAYSRRSGGVDLLMGRKLKTQTSVTNIENWTMNIFVHKYPKIQIFFYLGVYICGALGVLLSSNWWKLRAQTSVTTIENWTMNIFVHKYPKIQIFFYLGVYICGALGVLLSSNWWKLRAQTSVTTIENWTMNIFSQIFK